MSEVYLEKFRRNYPADVVVRIEKIDTSAGVCIKAEVEDVLARVTHARCLTLPKGIVAEKVYERGLELLVALLSECLADASASLDAGSKDARR